MLVVLPLAAGAEQKAGGRAAVADAPSPSCAAEPRSDDRRTSQRADLAAYEAALRKTPQFAKASDEQVRYAARKLMNMEELGVDTSDIVARPADGRSGCAERRK
jgi:hypothetical protein